MSAEPSLVLDPPTFERPAGSTLEGRVFMPEGQRARRVGVEVILAWNTEDKGHSEGEVASSEAVYDRDEPPPSVLSFRMRVPWSPWSHQGTQVKIRWTLRLTVTTDGFSRSWDAPFVVLPPSESSEASPYRGVTARETAR